jgi:hypothetical protein
MSRNVKHLIARSWEENARQGKERDDIKMRNDIAIP